MRWHTPGEWVIEYDEKRGISSIKSSHGALDSIAWVFGAGPASRSRATLFVAADDLLAALKQLHRHVAQHPTGAVGWNTALNVAEAAIARATAATEKEPPKDCGCAPGDCAADETGGPCGRAATEKEG